MCNICNRWPKNIIFPNENWYYFILIIKFIIFIITFYFLYLIWSNFYFSLVWDHSTHVTILFKRVITIWQILLCHKCFVIYTLWYIVIFYLGINEHMLFYNLIIMLLLMSKNQNIENDLPYTNISSLWLYD